MNNIELENNLSNEKSLEKEQISFLQTSIGKAVNTGLNIGIRYLLPDVIENEIIEIKDALIRDGIKEGVQTAINSAVNLGKSALGIITGNFENIRQMQTAVKSGGIIDSISDVINSTINKVVEKGKIPYSVGNALKNGKNAILNNVTKNIESEFENQVNHIEKINKYTENWKNYFNNKDFTGMERAYQRIRTKMKEIAPIENTIKLAKTVENLHKLIKNNGKDFNLTEEQLELAKLL